MRRAAATAFLVALVAADELRGRHVILSGTSAPEVMLLAYPSAGAASVLIYTSTKATRRRANRLTIATVAI